MPISSIAVVIGKVLHLSNTAEKRFSNLCNDMGS